MNAPKGRLSDDDYQRLLQLRSGLRRFLHWSEERARDSGLTGAQHQLLLAVKGHPDPRGPSIGQAAAYLALRPHSAVGLVNRAQSAGLVTRRPDPDCPGTVRLSLTPHGERHITALSHTHLTELARLAPTMQTLWRTLETDSEPSPEQS